MTFDGVQNEFEVRGRDLGRKLKEILREGNVTRIIVKDKHGNRYAEIPAKLGAVSFFMIPMITIVGALSALVADFRIVVERAERKAATPPGRSGLRQVKG